MIINNKMRDKRKEKLFVVNNDKEINLILGFTLLVILVCFTAISFGFYSNKRKPIVISAADFALYQSKDKLPEGGFYDDPKTITNPKEIKSQTDYIDSLKSCTQGNCVIDLDTGIKRCPADGNTKLLFNPAKETCTDAFGCPSELPYAVLSNGGTDRFGKCDPNVKCRCIKNISCPDYVLSTFDIYNGDPYSSESGSQNYEFTQNLKNNTEGFTFLNMEIDPSEFGSRFCQINPNYTNRITNGCNLNQHSGEPFNCNSNNDLFITNITSYNSYVYDTYSSSDETYTWYKKGSKTLPVYFPSNGTLIEPSNPDSRVTSLPLKGFYKTLNNSDSNFTFSYNGIKRLSGKEGYQLLNISSLSGVPGLEHGISRTIGSDSLQVDLNFDTYIFNSCAVHAVGPNNKNLLNCIQSRDQPCSQGQLAYNIDQNINPRSFCQLSNRTSLGLGKGGTKGSPYYDDPGYFTVSCVVGEGCSKILDRALKDADPDIGLAMSIKKKKELFFPNYELEGLSNIWVLNNNSTEGEPFSSRQGSPYEVRIDNKNSLLTFDQGDYWASNNTSINKFLSQEAKKGDTKLTINSTTNLYKGLNVSYKSENNNSVYSVLSGGVSLTTALDEDLNINEPITFYINDAGDTCGLVTDVGGVTKQGTSANFYSEYSFIGSFNSFKGLTILDNKEYDTNSNKGRPDNSKLYVVYKQFGFNGINYNTGTSFNINPLKYNNKDYFGKAERFYIPGSYWNSDLINTETINSYKFNAPMSPLVVMSNYVAENKIGISSQVLSLNDPSSSFKVEKSLYYPVWNDTTFKQECIMCKPYLLAYVLIKDDTTSISSTSNPNSISTVTIQYSGSHYQEYISINVSGNFSLLNNYYYSGFSDIRYPSLRYGNKSTTQNIVLSQENPNISIGDYILDSNGNFEITFECFPKFPRLNTSIEIKFFEDYFDTRSVSLEDKYSKYIYKDNKYINDFTPSNINVVSGDGFNFIPTNTSNLNNLFFGKEYCYAEIDPITKKRTVYKLLLKPVNRVSDIKRNIITTDYLEQKIIDNKPNFIQFVNLNEILSVDVDYEDETHAFGGRGYGSEIKISNITRGKITSINVTKPGVHFLNNEKPSVFISNYKLTQPNINTV